MVLTEISGGRAITWGICNHFLMPVRVKSSQVDDALAEKAYKDAGCGKYEDQRCG